MSAPMLRLLALLCLGIEVAVGPMSAVTARADDFEAADEEMIVSASRAPKVRRVVPSMTTVLEGAALETTVSTSLSDALRFVPGLHVTQDGGRGGRAALYLRGLDPNHVVVLVDGVRLNDPTNARGGSFDPTTLALGDIERVEVIRGPQSSIYGSDALAGAINVVTRRVDADAEPEFALRARGGRFKTGQVIGEASGGVGPVGLSLGATLDTFRDPNSSGGYDGASLKAKLDAELPWSIELEAFTRIHESSARSFPESSGGPQLASIRAVEDRNVREIMVGLALARSVFDGRGRVTLRASRAGRREDVDSPGIISAAVVPPSHTGDEYERWDVALTTDWRLPEFALASWQVGTRIVAGADVVVEDGESDVYLDFGTVPVPPCPGSTTPGGVQHCPFNADRLTIGQFAEIEQSIGPWIVWSGSLRYDATSDEENRLSPSIGLTADVPETPVSIFGSYGRGFKRPSFYSLDNPLVGSQDLEVERSQGWEVGLRVRTDDGRWAGQLAYFDIEVENIIDFNDVAFRLENQSRLVSRGVEAELRWQALDRLRFEVGATFNPTKFGGTSMQPENRPRWQGHAEIVSQPIDSLELGLRLLLVGSSKAAAVQIGGRAITLAGYERLDVRATWTPLDWLSIVAEIENLTNRTRREAVGFESPGIAPRLGVTLLY